MANKRRRSLSSTSVQLSDEQFDELYDIKDFEKIQYNSEVLRDAFDYYVEHKYPQFKRKRV